MTLFPAATAGWAAVVSWVPNADGTWNHVINWSSSPQLPTVVDEVIIDVGGPVVRTVTHDTGNTSVNSLHLEENLLVSGGTFLVGTSAQLNRTLTLGAALVGGIYDGAPIVCESGAYVRSVTSNGGLNLNHRLDVREGLTLNGVASFAAGASMRSEGSQTLSGTGTLMFPSSSSTSISFFGEGTLTLASGITLRGRGVTIGQLDGGSGHTTLVNNGVVSADLPGTTTILSDSVFNAGTLEARGGGQLNVAPRLRFINTGTIAARGGGTIILGNTVTNGTWTSAVGTIVIDNASLRLNGAFTTADLNPAALQRNGGTILLSGTLNNAASTLAVGTVHLAGGRIVGGTVASALAFSTENNEAGTLHGVTLNAPLVSNTSGFVRALGGLTVNNEFRASVSFDETQTLAGTGTVVIGSPGGGGTGHITVANQSTLTVANTITVRGGSGSLGTGGFGDNAIDNRGWIIADSFGSGVYVTPTLMTSTGTLQAIAGGVLHLAPPGTRFTNTGGIVVATGGTVHLGAPGGTWTSAGGRISLGDGSLRLGGTFATADLNPGSFSRALGGAAGTLILAGVINNHGSTLNLGPMHMVTAGRINGGSTAGRLDFNSLNGGTGTLDGVAVGGGMRLNGGTALVLSGVQLNSTATLTTGGTMRFEGSQSVTGNGTIFSGPGATNRIDVAGGSTVTLGTGIVVRGSALSMSKAGSTFGDAALVNDGSLSADVGGGTIAIAPSVFANAGTVEARLGGSLSIEPTLAFTNTGTVAARTSGVVSIGAGGGTWTSAGGTLLVNGARLNLFGNFATSDLNQGSFQRNGGTVALFGTLNNTAAVLNVGTMQLHDGAAIFGGTSAGTLHFVGGTGGLDGVTSTAAMHVAQGASVRVTRGLALNAQLNATESFSTIRFVGEQALAGEGTLVFAGSGNLLQGDSDATLTIGGSVTVRGGGASVGGSQFGNSALVIDGRVQADVPGSGISVVPTVLVNHGTLHSTLGSTLTVGATTFTNGGTITAETNSVTHVQTPLVATGGTVGGNGRLRAAAGASISGTVVKSGGGTLKVTGPLDIAPGAALDLAAGGAIIDYAGASPIDNVVGFIINGYNGGAWNGTGINSSTAAADAALAVGYGEASEVLASFPATFMGESVDATSVLLRLTRRGDANLDGVVNLADFNRLAANFGSTTGDWSQGDFSYDGVINLQDFNRLAGNFGQSAGRAGVTPEDWAMLASAVPEPAGGALVAALYAALLQRRCRRCV